MRELQYLVGATTLTLDTEKCTGCRMCVMVCPHGVFVIENRQARIADRDACMECGACAMNCLGAAIFVEVGTGCAKALLRSAIRGGNPERYFRCCCHMPEACGETTEKYLPISTNGTHARSAPTIWRVMN